MNIFDLLESPGMGHPRDTKGVQSAADQSAASVIGSGTTEREDKKKPVRMMGSNIKEGFDIAGIKNWLLKLKQGLSTEAAETKTMFDTYVRYTQGQASEEEMAAANEQFKDLLRGLGMGTLAAMPGSVVTLPLVFKLAKKFNIELMPSAFKNDVEEAAVKPNFKMPPESLQDKMYRQHQELRKQRGAPSPEEYKERIAQKQKEIDDLKEAHPNQQLSIYNPDGPTYRQEKMPSYDIDDIYSRGQLVDLDPEVGDINAPEDHLDAAEKANLKKILKQYMDKLSPVERNVLMMRYYQDHTLDSAGKILGATPERVRQIEARAMRKIRQLDKGTARELLGLSQRRTDEGILDRATPKLPKPRNPADQVLRGKVNAAGKHLDKKRRQELNPKHKHQDLMAESLRPGERHHFEINPETGKREYKGIRGDRTDAPQRAKDDPAARADQERRAHIQHDRGLTEQGIDESQVTKITDYDLWLDEVKALGAEIHPQKDRNVLVAQSWDGEEIGKFHLGKEYGFINRSGELDETIRKMGSQYRLLSKKGKNLGTFDTKAGAEKHEREVQYFKHKNMEEGWKGKLAGAALAGAAALGGGDVDAQNIDLPGPQVSYVAHVSAEANGREVHRTMNLGSKYSSEQEAYDDIERSLQAKGITRYSINIEQKYDAQYYPGSNQPRGGTATGRNYGPPGIGDMVINHIGREIRAGIPSKGGYATGGTNRGERPRDGSQWWRDQLPQIMKEEPLEEDIESHLYLMSRAGYDIVQEEWSDKYKRSINCSNPKGFSQKAHCAGRKKNESVAEEKVRLDPKCWSGKKIGNPKTKMKGGVRVNNCVPK